MFPSDIFQYRSWYTICIRAALRLGDMWYIISKRWWDAWDNYVSHYVFYCYLICVTLFTVHSTKIISIKRRSSRRRPAATIRAICRVLVIRSQRRTAIRTPVRVCPRHSVHSARPTRPPRQCRCTRHPNIRPAPAGTLPRRTQRSRDPPLCSTATARQYALRRPAPAMPLTGASTATAAGRLRRHASPLPPPRRPPARRARRPRRSSSNRRSPTRTLCWHRSGSSRRLHRNRAKSTART